MHSKDANSEDPDPTATQGLHLSVQIVKIIAVGVVVVLGFYSPLTYKLRF